MTKRNTPILRMVSWLLAVVMLLPFATMPLEAAVVNFLSPLPGQANSGRYVEVAVSFNTQTDLTVTKLELWIDGKFYSKKVLAKPESRGVCSFQWDTAGFTNGGHFLLVKMFAGNREIASISGSGSVGESNSDVIPPLVKITNIKSGSVIKGNQVIKLNAVDNSGQYPLVSLLVDQKLKLLKNTPPYAYELDTTAYNDGQHEIQTYAFDSEGNKSDVVTLNVVFSNGKIKSASVEQPAPIETTVLAAAPKTVAAEVSAPITIVPNQDSENVGAARTVSVNTEADMAGSAVSTAAKAPVKVAKVTAPVKTAKTIDAVVTPQPKLVAKVKPVEVVKPQATTAVVIESSATRVAKVAAVKPKVDVPVVMAKADTMEIPAARSTASFNDIISSKSVARIKVERPMVMASASISTPAIPAAPKAVKKVVVATAKPVVKSTEKIAVKPVVKKAAVAAIAKPAPKPVVIAISKPAPKPVSHIAISKIKESQKMAAHKMIFSEKPLAVVDKAVPAKSLKSAKIADSKPVRMAMAPKVVKPLASTKALVQPTKAKYDVAATELPKQGHVKVRDLVKSLNGVVLWDSDSRTVTAYVKNMKIEMRIGKGLVQVNGKKMKVNLVPYVVNGRTIIDIRLYNKACMVSGKKESVASTKPIK